MKILTNKLQLASVCLAALFFSTASVATPYHHHHKQQGSTNWKNYNKDFQNTRNADGEKHINRYNVDKLIVNWQKEVGPSDAPPLSAIDPEDNTPPIESRAAFGEVASNPVVVGKIVYVSTTAGRLYALNRKTGKVIWEKDAFLDYSRPGRQVTSFKASPVVKGDYLLLGGQFNIFTWVLCPDSDFAGICVPHDGGNLLKINRHTGKLVWNKKIGPDVSHSLRGSVSFHKNTIFVPVSSVEEEFARVQTAKLFGGSDQEPYPCCNFQGAVAAVDFHSGHIKWFKYMSPGKDIIDGILSSEDDVSFHGVSVWHHAPTVDKQRKQIFVGTSNNVSAPEKAIQCERHRLDPDNEAAPDLPAGITCANLNDKTKNYVGSIVALDMKTGKVNWVFRGLNYDAWNHACADPDFYIAELAPGTFLNNPPINEQNCPALTGADFGFTMPTLVHDVDIPGKGKRDVLMAANKNGFVYAINPANGKLYYDRVKVGPGGIVGGINLAGATDGKTYFVNVRNSNNTGRRFDPENLPVIPNRFYDDPLLLNSGEFLYNTGSAPNTFNSLIGGTYPESGAGFDGNHPDGRWALINPPQDAIDRADGITNVVENGKLLTTNAFFAAIDIATGKIKWQTPIRAGGRDILIADVDCGVAGTCGPAPLPFNSYSEYLVNDRSGPGLADAAMTHANGVLFAPICDGENSQAADTQIVALDAKDGTYLYEFKSTFEGNRTCGGGRKGVTVAKSEVLFGGGFNDNGGLSGFVLHGNEIRDNKLYSLCLDQNYDGRCDSKRLKQCITNKFKYCTFSAKKQCRHLSGDKKDKCLMNQERKCHNKATKQCKRHYHR